ncbi:MAG: universal stress protein [Ignavibacteriae bacterium]|nr:universal stress protein [Ignavibacteriota bacterium]
MAKTKRAPRRKKAAAPSSNTSPIRLRSILVPIDFSAHSKNALKYAVPFARQFHASIELLYVVEPTVYPADFSFGQVGFPNVEDEMRKRAAKQLDRLVKDEVAGVVTAGRTIRVGRPFYEINQHAKDRKIDLIIIATHGHTGMEHILFGSTAEKVVRGAPCPVLVVRSGERGFV